MFAHRFAVALAALVLCSAPAFSQTAPPRGPEFLVNTTTENRQSSPRVALLSDGGFVVVWADGSRAGGDASGLAIKAQRYNSAGAAVGGEFLVNTTTSANQSEPDVAGLTGGGFVITWTDSSAEAPDTSASSIRAQRYDANGARAGGEMVLNSVTLGGQSYSSIEALSDGGFVVTWTDRSQTLDNDAFGIVARRFTAAGAPQGPETRVNTTVPGFQSHSRVAGLRGGGYVIGWVDTHLGGPVDTDQASRVQRFDASGVAVGSEFLPYNTTINTQDNVSLAGLQDGGFVLTWADHSQVGPDRQSAGIRARRYNAAGMAQGADFQVNSTESGLQSLPSVAGLTGGGFVIAWMDDSQTGGDDDLGSVRAQLYDSSGAPLGGEFLVNTSTKDYQLDPDVAALENNGFVIVWTDDGQNGADTSSSAIRGQMFSGALPANDRVIDVAITSASDFGATGTQELANETDFATANVHGNLELAVIVQNPGQFDAYTRDAEVRLTLDGAVFSRHVQASDFSSGGSCVLTPLYDGRQGSNTMTFRTPDLSQCDARVSDRVYSAGANDDDMVFSLPIELRGGVLNATVEIINSATGLVIGSDTHDRDDSTSAIDPIARTVDGFHVMTFGTVVPTDANPYGQASQTATLESGYNALRSTQLGDLRRETRGQVFNAGVAETASFASHAEQVDLSVTFGDATGLEAIILSRGAKTMRAALDGDGVAHFTITAGSALTLADLDGASLSVSAEPDDLEDTRINNTRLSTQTRVTFIDSVHMIDETLEGGLDQIAREGSRSNVFEWVGDSRATTRNVFRITGLGQDLPRLKVTLTHSSGGLNGEYELIPSGAVRNGELVLTEADIEAAVGAPFGRADVTFFVEAGGVVVRRFMVSANGSMTDMGSDWVDTGVSKPT